MSCSVLFVDDEPHVLDALRRNLRARHVDWHCRFAGGGEEALALLAEAPAEVVVSDVRMPGMDGKELLTCISQTWPGTVRLALSGYSEHETALRLAGLAHQFLPKPCQLERLIEFVERGAAVSRELEQPELRAVLAPLSDLPAHGEHLEDLARQLRRADPDGEQLAACFADDPALCAKLLKMANAPLFCPAGSVASLEQAIALLGTERLRSLLQLGYFGSADEELHERLDLALWYRRAEAIAALALRIARIEDCDPILLGQLQAAAPLLDLGMLALAVVDADRYDEIFVLDEAPLIERERSAYGCSHAEAGAFLAGLWNLPLVIREAIRCHHRPPSGGEAGFDLVAICHCANVLYEEQHGSGMHLDEGYLRAIGRHHRLEQWRQLAAAEPSS